MDAHYILSLLLLFLPVSMSAFTNTAAYCECDQRGATQGMACICENYDGAFPEDFPAEMVKMSFVSCSLFSVPSGAFDGLELLREIHFTRSKITVIESDAFKDFNEFDLITFRGDAWGDEAALISTIEENAFHNLRFDRGTTDDIDNGILFDGVKIGIIKKHAFNSISNLPQLTVERVEINTINDLSFHGTEDIVELTLKNSNINNAISMPFEAPVSFVTFIMNQVTTPVLSAFMLPSTSSEVILTQSTFDTMQCGIFADGIPAKVQSEDNYIICDCRLDWLFTGPGSTSTDAIIEGFVCKGPKSAIGHDLIDYKDMPLPCDGVTSIKKCDLYEDDGNDVPILAIVLPVIFIVSGVVALIVVLLVIRHYKKKEKKAKYVPSAADIRKSDIPPDLPPPRQTPYEETYYSLPDEYLKARESTKTYNTDTTGATYKGGDSSKAYNTDSSATTYKGGELYLSVNTND